MSVPFVLDPIVRSAGVYVLAIGRCDSERLFTRESRRLRQNPLRLAFFAGQDAQLRFPRPQHRYVVSCRMRRFDYAVRTRQAMEKSTRPRHMGDKTGRACRITAMDSMYIDPLHQVQQPVGPLKQHGLGRLPSESVTTSAHKTCTSLPVQLPFEACIISGLPSCCRISDGSASQPLPSLHCRKQGVVAGLGCV